MALYQLLVPHFVEYFLSLVLSSQLSEALNYCQELLLVPASRCLESLHTMTLSQESFSLRIHSPGRF